MRDFRKNAVKLEMKFRHFTDPAFLDPKANDKIFVPVQNVSINRHYKTCFRVGRRMK